MTYARAASLAALWTIDARSAAWRWGVAWPFERTFPTFDWVPRLRPGRIPLPAELWLPRPRNRTRSRRLGVLRTSGILSAIALAAACAFPYVAPNSLTDPYIEQHRLTQAVELTDARGNWFGVMPRAMSAVRAPSSDSPDYLATDVQVPEAWWEILVALEDRNIGSWRSVHGIDILSLGRAVIGLSGGTDGRGGSTLAMQLVRSMRGLNPAEGSSFAKMARKLTEVRDGALLYRRLGGRDGPQFRQYFARHIPLVIGAPGSRMGTPLHGIGMTSQVLWGVPPSQLNLAQQAVLAAAVWRPIILAPDGDPRALAARDARWRLVVERAIRGLELTYPDDARRREAIAILRRMAPPRPHLHQRLNLTRLESGRAFQVAANPEAMARALALPELTAANGEMLNRFGRGYSAQVTALRLTIDVEENRRFRRQVETQLEAIERALAGRLTVPLRNVPGRPAGADIVIALVHEGRIVRFFSNSQEPIFSGSLAERDEQGRFRLDRSLRPVGSLAKVMLAVRLGRTDSPHSRYCNEAFGARHNADGSAGGPCHEPSNWRNATNVFGRSLNLPLVWRLRGVSDAELREMAGRYRLAVPGQTSTRVALPLGMATARPSDLVGTMQAISRGARGLPARASEPSIVARYRLLGQPGWVAVPRNPTAFDFRRDFNPQVSRFVRAVLSAPAEEGGTLNGLNNALPGADLHIAKSGTSEAGEEGRVRDKYALGAFHTPAGDYAYLVLVGARNPTSGLGTEISWRPFYPLLRMVVTARPGS